MTQQGLTVFGSGLWNEQLAAHGEKFSVRSELRHNISADVCIIGGGFTGLWSAYYLSRTDPSLRIVVIEKNHAGFGASSRNGGWVSTLFPKSTTSLAKKYGRDSAIRLRRAMVESLNEMESVIRRENIDCNFLREGTVVFARNPVQLDRAQAEHAVSKDFGVDDSHLLNENEVTTRFAVTGTGPRGPLGAHVTSDCASVNPAKLVTKLATLVEEGGVEIFESTEALGWESRKVFFKSSSPLGETHTGTVSAESIIVALEGYGSGIEKIHRRILPIYSMMLATEVIDESVWEKIGLSRGQTFSDFRHLLIYGQRTADNRFAFGGRGARYHPGSTTKPSFDHSSAVLTHLTKTLRELFPVAKDAAIEHHWGGALGISRDWHPSASFNPKSGVAFAGGYVGDGVTLSNLCGRVLKDLLLGEKTELTNLPFVNHRSHKWEVEPFRYLGANAGLLGTTLADVEEKITHKPSLIAKALAPLTGH